MAEPSPRTLKMRYDKLVLRLSTELQENHLLRTENAALRKQIEQLRMDLLSEQMESMQLADHLESHDAKFLAAES